MSAVRLSLSVLVILALFAATTVSAAKYDVQQAMAWIESRGCRNATISNCPGNRLCTDAEFFARALAAGKVIALNPDSDSQAGYNNYQGYNLCLSNEFETFLSQELGWIDVYNAASPTFPQGAVVITHEWTMPMMAVGNGRCTSHTPVVSGGPHCNVWCPYFNVMSVYTPPQGTMTISVPGASMK
jgi:hypothetical protein